MNLKPLLRTGFFFLWLPAALSGQDYRYTLTWDQPGQHTYQVALSTTTQTDTATWFELPVWRPGRYIQQDYAAGVWGFAAKDDRGKALAVVREEGSRWRVKHGKTSQVNVSYQYYADNADAGSSLLTFDQAYFNPVNLFVYVPGRMKAKVYLSVPSAPASWKAATALKRTSQAFDFEAATWHEFADSPTVLAEKIKTLYFDIDSARIVIHLQGDYLGDEKTDKALLNGVRAITREQAALFGGLPFKTYHHIYRLLPYDLRHAVEHSYSASYAMPSRVTQSASAITSMFNITSHEFFHVWNVKRIRPAALLPYDYSRRQHTVLHWFTEGVTDYYASLTVYRAGLTDKKSLLRNFEGDIQSVLNNTASGFTSPEASSMMSWLAISPYKTSFLDISFYTLGACAGLHLDLALRESTKGEVSLDAVMRYLNQTYGDTGRGVPENGIQLACEALTGKSWEAFFATYIAGVAQPDWEQVFGPFGITYSAAPSATPGGKGIGASRFESYPQGVYLVALDPNGDLARAGLSSGDVITQVDGKAAANFDLDAYVNGLKEGAKVTLGINRNGSNLEISFKYTGATAPVKVTLTESAKIRPDEAALQKGWLDPLAD